MRISFSLLLVLALLTITSVGAKSQSQGYLPDRLYVQFSESPSAPHRVIKDSFGNRTLDSLFANSAIDSLTPVFFEPPQVEDLVLFHSIGMEKHWTIYLQDTMELAEIFTSLALDPSVEVVDTLFFGEALIEPADFGYSLQWNHNQGNNIDLNSPEAWDFDTTAFSGLLAIVDQGIDSLHPELNRNLWKNATELNNAFFDWGQYDWVGDGVDNDLNGIADDFFGWDFWQNRHNVQPDYYQSQWPPCDEGGLLQLSHGVLVAGVAMAQTSEEWLSYNDDMVGVIWNTKVINVKISRQTDGYTDAIAASQGIEYAALSGAKVISLSFAFERPYGLQSAITLAEARGALVVCGLPNVGQSGRFPWSFSNTLVVSKIDRYGQSMHHPYPDIILGANGVVAPGVEVPTTWKEITTSANCANSGTQIGADHVTLSGTSLAIPQVASIAAMVTSTRKSIVGTEPYLTPAELKNVLIQTANSQIHPNDPAGFDPYWGHGLVNFEKAIYAVSRGDPDNNGIITISDAVYMINYVFASGPAPSPRIGVGDCNCDGMADNSDSVYLVNYIFAGGPPPQICFNFTY